LDENSIRQLSELRIIELEDLVKKSEHPEGMDSASAELGAYFPSAFDLV
jgi:hypothetical protein